MNIGNFIYTKNTKTGALFCDWSFYSSNGKLMSGTGKTKDSPNRNFTGEYNIIYTHNTGYASKPFNLRIEKNDNETFNLKWYQNSILKCIGLGAILGGKLVGGWKYIE